MQYILYLFLVLVWSKIFFHSLKHNCSTLTSMWVLAKIHFGHLFASKPCKHAWYNGGVQMLKKVNPYHLHCTGTIHCGVLICRASGPGLEF